MLINRKRFAMSSERQKDAHDKIRFGGLVVKAGLKDADRAFILGALIHAATLAPESELYKNFVRLGEKSFREIKPR